MGKTRRSGIPNPLPEPTNSLKLLALSMIFLDEALWKQGSDKEERIEWTALALLVASVNFFDLRDELKWNDLAMDFLWTFA